MVDFELERAGLPPEKIIPKSSTRVEIEEAISQSKSIVDQLTEDVSGIGPKAAIRYLLRYEYGFGSKSLSDEFDITAPTISNQTTTVRNKILKYPKLARIIGQWRAERANLKRPDIDQQTLFEDTLTIRSFDIDASIDYISGQQSDPYSWRVKVKARSKLDDWWFHIRLSYIVDQEYGVFLKRMMRGVSHVSSDQEPIFEPARTYTVFALPHEELANRNNDLLNAIEYHTVYDLTESFVKHTWTGLMDKARTRDSQQNNAERTPQAENGLPEKLLEEINKTRSTEPIQKYTQEVATRNNLENLLRIYPHTSLSEIPYSTVDLLWNGSCPENYITSKSMPGPDAHFDTSIIHRKTNRI